MLPSTVILLHGQLPHMLHLNVTFDIQLKFQDKYDNVSILISKNYLDSHKLTTTAGWQFSSAILPRLN